MQRKSTYLRIRFTQQLSSSRYEDVRQIVWQIEEGKNSVDCQGGTETQNHAVNCPSVVSDRPPVQIAELYGDVQPNDSNVVEIVDRYTLFENALKRIGSS